MNNLIETLTEVLPKAGIVPKTKNGTLVATNPEGAILTVVRGQKESTAEIYHEVVIAYPDGSKSEWIDAPNVQPFLIPVIQVILCSFCPAALPLVADSGCEATLVMMLGCGAKLLSCIAPSPFGGMNNNSGKYRLEIEDPLGRGVVFYVDRKAFNASRVALMPYFWKNGKKEPARIEEGKTIIGGLNAS